MASSLPTTETKKLSLNNPFYKYPGIPCAGYHNTEEIIPELERLNHFITHSIYDNKETTLLHLTIGAAMEERAIDNNEDIKMQWKQLLPHHLEKYAIENPMKKVINIIISPNKGFTNKFFTEPTFVKKTNETFHWQKIDNKHYKSKKCNFEVYIFCTMLPHIDTSYVELVNRLKKTNFTNGDMTAESYMQTEYDVEFIKKFYSNLNMLFTTVNANNGCVTCFSFAVFNNSTAKSSINKYQMFSEINELFTVTNLHNRLLCEWIYITTNYSVISYNHYPHKYINYNDPLHDLKNYYIDITFNYDMSLRINYNDPKTFIDKVDYNTKQIFKDNMYFNISLEKKYKCICEIINQDNIKLNKKISYIVKNHIPKDTILKSITHILNKTSEDMIDIYCDIISSSNNKSKDDKLSKLHCLEPEILAYSMLLNTSIGIISNNNNYYYKHVSVTSNKLLIFYKTDDYYTSVIFNDDDDIIKYKKILEEKIIS